MPDMRETAQLFDFPSPTRVPSNLPTLGTRVVGRADVIEEMQRQVQQHRLVSIVGTGGIGKTTVAMAAAARAGTAFRDGVWLVDLAPMRDGALVPHAIASAMGLVVHSADVLPALCRFLRDRTVLLVLDNCEHLAAAVARCATRLLHEAPHVRLMATSRAALAVDGEVVHRLAGLAAPPPHPTLDAETAAAYPAIQLFVDRATDRMETFVFDDAAAPIVADICRNLDGIALAIELAAMRVDAFGVKDLQQQLHARLSVLSGARAGLERHRTLAATLDWSVGLLPPDEAGLLRAVSVFAGAFRLDGACAVGHVAPDVAARVLAGLVSKSLLVAEPDAPGTYRLLETTRAYGLERLGQAGEEPPVRRRHASHVCDVLERAATEWGQRVSREWGAAHGAHLGDLRAALAWTAAAPVDGALLIRLTVAGTLLWNHFSLTDESRVHLARAIAELGDAGGEDTPVEMNLQFALAGAILYTRGITPEARLAIRRALHLSEQLGDIDCHLRCLRLAATIELFFGEHDTARRTLESFLAIAGVHDPSAVAEGETHLGVAETFVGRLHDARSRMERLHGQASQDFNDTRFARFQYSNSVNMLVVLCHAQWLTGQPDAAARTADTILDYGRQASHELSLSIALAWNCLTYLWLGRDDQCSRSADQLDDLVERHGIVTWRPIVTFSRGALASLRRPGHPDAIDALERAVAAFRATGHLARLPWYVAVLAEAQAQGGRLDDADATLHDALSLASVQNERWCRPELLRIQATLATARGRDAEAERALQQSLAMSREIGALSWRLRASRDLAALWGRQSRTAEARDLLTSVREAFREGFETRDMVAVSRLLADLD